jgi:hypothetical protein
MTLLGFLQEEQLHTPNIIINLNMFKSQDMSGVAFYTHYLRVAWGLIKNIRCPPNELGNISTYFMKLKWLWLLQYKLHWTFIFSIKWHSTAIWFSTILIFLWYYKFLYVYISLIKLLCQIIHVHRCIHVYEFSWFHLIKIHFHMFKTPFTFTQIVYKSTQLMVDARKWDALPVNTQQANILVEMSWT